jgi:hypothetical protein
MPRVLHQRANPRRGTRFIYIYIYIYIYILENTCAGVRAYSAIRRDLAGATAAQGTEEGRKGGRACAVWIDGRAGDSDLYDCVCVMSE